MEKETLVIASTANERFATGLGMMMCSALSCASQKSVRFHIIEDQILPDTKAFLKERADAVANLRGIELELNFIPFETLRLPQLSGHRGSMLTYGRVCLPDLLVEPGIYYVDADVLCNREFPGPHEMGKRFQDYLIAGVPDAWCKVLGAECPWQERLTEYEKNGVYINAGFVWMNLESLRKFGLKDKFQTLAAEGLATKYADQTMLNFLLRGRIGTMESGFNRQMSTVGNFSGIGPDCNFHFIGANKPWLEPAGKSLYLFYPLYALAAAYFGYSEGPLKDPSIGRTPFPLYFYIYVRLPIFKLTGSRQVKKYQTLKTLIELMGSLRRDYRKKFASLPPVARPPLIP